MKRKTLLYFTQIVFLFSGSYAIAYDFYGVSVSDRDAPAVFMRMGISGYRPIVNDIQPNSFAEKFGFSKGDVILKVNGNEVRTTSNLSRFVTDKISVFVFSAKGGGKTLIIDRLAIEAEKKHRIAETNRLADEAKRIAEEEAAAIAKQQAESINNPTQEASYGASYVDRSTADEYGRNEKERKLSEENKRVISEKLSKVKCTGIPGECGPGRACLIITQMGRRFGECKNDADADRLVENFKEMKERQRQSEINDMSDKIDRIDRKLRGW